MGERHPPAGTAPRRAATAVQHEVAQVPARGAAALRRRDGLRARAGRSRGPWRARSQLGDTGYTPPEPGHPRGVRRLRAAPLRVDGRPRARVPHDVRRDDGRRRDPPPRHRSRATASSSRRPCTRRSTSAVAEAGAVVERVPLAATARPAGSSICSASRRPSPAARARCCCATRTTRPAPCTRARASRPSPTSPPASARRSSATRSTRRSCTAGHTFTPFLDASSDGRARSATPSPARARPTTSPA